MEKSDIGDKLATLADIDAKDFNELCQIMRKTFDLCPKCREDFKRFMEKCTIQLRLRR